jgi:8-oxo-dGTP pyrophosphatase MutT (NUDIX family)
MRVDRPPPGEEINLGEETVPRQAASVIVLRDGADGLEVMLVQRNPEARFMPGAWVFPGGAVHDDDAGHEGTALRELAEEASVSLAGPEELVAFSRWITPAEVKVRFDTWFYVAAAPADADPRPDGSETVDLRWIGPAAALEAYARDELMLVFPTIKHLEQLREFRSVEHALDTARARDVQPVLPKIVVRDGSPHVLLPCEPGYEE